MRCANHEPKRKALPSLGEQLLRTALRPMPARAYGMALTCYHGLDRLFVSSLRVREPGSMFPDHALVIMDDMV